MYWPGTAAGTKDMIFSLRDNWVDKLHNLSDGALVCVEHTKWPFENKPFYELAAWLDIELAKNAAEIGYCRFLYVARN